MKFNGKPLVIEKNGHYYHFIVIYYPVPVGYDHTLKKVIYSKTRTKEVAEYSHVCRTAETIANDK